MRQAAQLHGAAADNGFAMTAQVVKVRVLAFAAALLTAAIAFSPQRSSHIHSDFASRSVDSSRSLAAR